MDKYLIKISDDELLEVTEEELLQMEANAEEFDGFYGWIVLKKISDGENILQEKIKLTQPLQLVQPGYLLLSPTQSRNT